MANQIRAPRIAFLEAFGSIAMSAGARRASEAFLAREEALMKVSVGGASCMFEAEGDWDKAVRVPASFIIGLSKLPPRGDPISMFVADGRLCIGDMSVDCLLQDAHHSQIFDLPPGLDLATRLRLLLPHSHEVLEQAGLLKELFDAEGELQVLVQEAAESLAMLGVSEEDLGTFVRSKLKGSIKE
ncbi:MAG: hypothetical protein SF187_23790 [Deltaproteobacteria bacterium]|nr:hypothetical protein [Deltaproteobacteria bacterium]